MNKGFALIEVLVASLLICMFAVSFTFLVASGIKQVKTSISLTGSIILAKSVMEEIRSRPFNSIFSYNNTTFDNGAGRIVVSSAGNDLAMITVKHEIELSTLRSRY